MASERVMRRGVLVATALLMVRVKGLPPLCSVTVLEAGAMAPAGAISASAMGRCGLAAESQAIPPRIHAGCQLASLGFTVALLWLWLPIIAEVMARAITTMTMISRTRVDRARSAGWGWTHAVRDAGHPAARPGYLDFAATTSW